MTARGTILVCNRKNSMPAGGGVEVREQRHEHSTVQLFATPVLVAQFHGCFHMVPAICRRER